MPLLFFYSPTANCGAPPSGVNLDVGLSGLFRRDASTGEVVANEGAMASYNCRSTNEVMVGAAQLTCLSVDGGAPQWSPVEAPACIGGINPEFCIGTLFYTVVDTDQSTKLIIILYALILPHYPQYRPLL